MNEEMFAFENMDETGNLALDFANTALWHASDQPQETIHSYGDLVRWSLQAGLLNEDETGLLLVESESHPDKANEVLEESISLRELIYRIFSAVAHDLPPKRGDLEGFNAILSEAERHAKLIHTSTGFEWGWASDRSSFDRVLWPIARSTAALLTSEDLDKLGECADDRGCGWLFIDTSRNRSRRWCSMESCGNRAKARRHYKRRVQKEKAP
jgi:predicted RNA-binding Zn ribbon-like protein